MTTASVRGKALRDKLGILTYVGLCCREWVLCVGVPVGSCGLCGERPTYLREDEQLHECIYELGAAYCIVCGEPVE